VLYPVPAGTGFAKKATPPPSSPPPQTKMFGEGLIKRDELDEDATRVKTWIMLPERLKNKAIEFIRDSTLDAEKFRRLAIILQVKSYQFVPLLRMLRKN
jgi:hypothetical protein